MKSTDLVASSLMALGTLFAMASCENDRSASDGSPGIDLPPGCVLSREPKDNPECVDYRVGIFVSPRGNDSDPGTKEQPVKTLNAAIEKAGKKPRIYVCNSEALAEGAKVETAVSIYGGFGCSDWVYAPGTSSQVAPARGVALTVKNVATAITISDMAFTAGRAVDAGESSIAALIASSPAVTLRRVRLAAGQGMKGRDGSLSAVSFPSVLDLRGNAANGDAGGQPKPCVCPALGAAPGGAGGGPGVNGSAGSASPPTGVDGGAGGASGSGCAAGGGGQDGSNAPPGANASAASVPGSITDNGWIPSSGGSGKPGGPGQGGGGGAGPASAPGAGGAGGCGACGGAAGTGGTGGGASIALVLFNSPATLESCTLSASKGGDGGNGAAGQAGQTPGGNGGLQDPNGGCQGGRGGAGGLGGAGAGGAGGASVGIAWKGGRPVTDDATNNATTIAGAGARGTGGAGNDGPMGPAVAIFEVP